VGRRGGGACSITGVVLWGSMLSRRLLKTVGTRFARAGLKPRPSEAGIRPFQQPARLVLETSQPVPLGVRCAELGEEKANMINCHSLWQSNRAASP
jgi:hypothetical protein